VLAVAATAAAGGSSWSAPAPLAPCASAPGAPRVVFPSDSPSNATGPGAIVWSAGPRCPGGEGARVAPIGAGDLPGASTVPRSASGRALAPLGPLLASAAPHGQILIAGSSPHGPAGGLLVQGAADGVFTQLSVPGGVGVPGGAGAPGGVDAPGSVDAPGGVDAPAALATAYLGDVALASPPARAPHGGLRGLRSGSANGLGSGSANRNGGSNGSNSSGLRVHVERFFAHSFTRNVSAATVGASPVQAVALALDYRSEALAVWTQAGVLYAQLLPSRGAPRRTQRLAPVGADVHLSALLSDDEHGIVAWAQQAGGETSVYLDRSLAGVRFTAPQLLERFVDPPGPAPPNTSPQLVRLSSESVLLAWAGVLAGRWVVHVAPVDLDGAIAPSTIAAPEGDALFAGLAAGPRADALVLWSEPAPGGAAQVDLERQALFAAPAFDISPGRSAFGEVEAIAPVGQLSDASLAIDPGSGRAIAVWRGQAGAIEYSLSGPSAGP
jgi:hypothetical protein